jgi:dienelactone hydrolase
MHREPASEDLVGILLHPDDGDDFRRLPGVLLLGGSEGGLHEDHAALLAEQGYAVLALAYYGLPGVPQVCQDIPLEYFGRALDYLRAHPRVDGDRIGVFGGSKGGEVALLIGVTFPDRGVRAVVSVAGSGVVTQGICQSVFTGDLRTILTTPVANWTYQGHELAYLPNVVTPRMERALAAGEPVALGWARPDLGDVERVAQAAIPVERINGAVLLVVGADDQNYGVEFHKIAARRLEEHRHPHAWKHVVHEGAGHFIIAPHIAPTSQTSPGPGGITFLHGGTPEDDARARAETWRETVEFFASEL